jgi:hypothetical protein
VAGGTVFARDADIQYSPILAGYEYLGNVVLWMTQSGSAWNIAGGDSIGVASYGAWVHRAVCRDGNTIRTFMNGTQVATISSSLALAASTADVGIGTYLAGTYFYHGYIDELRISKGVARWTSDFTPPTEAYGPSTPVVATPAAVVFGGDWDRPVSDETIISLAHFDDGLGDELAGTWTASGTVTATSTAKFGNAMDCNTGEIVSPSISSMAVGLGDFTIEFWFYFPGPCLPGEMQGFIGPTSGDFYKCDGRLRLGGGPTYYLDVSWGFSSYVSQIHSGGTEILGWNHFAASRSSGTLRIFVNGTQIYSVADTSNITADQISLGQKNWFGAVSRQAFFDEVRFSTEAKYTGFFSVPSAAFEYSPEYIAARRRLLSAPGGSLFFGGAP